MRRCLEERPLPVVLAFPRPEQVNDPRPLWTGGGLCVRGATAPRSPYERPEAIDWTLLGRIVLGAMIGRQLWWVSPRVGLTPTGRLVLTSTIGSLLEVTYLQLWEHVPQRLAVGHRALRLLQADAILNRRRRQAWHPRLCASAGRKRRSRELRSASAARSGSGATLDGPPGRRGGQPPRAARRPMGAAGAGHATGRKAGRRRSLLARTQSEVRAKSCRRRSGPRRAACPCRRPA